MVLGRQFLYQVLITTHVFYPSFPRPGDPQNPKPGSSMFFPSEGLHPHGQGLRLHRPRQERPTRELPTSSSCPRLKQKERKRVHTTVSCEHAPDPTGEARWCVLAVFPVGFVSEQPPQYGTLIPSTHMRTVSLKVCVCVCVCVRVFVL